MDKFFNLYFKNIKQFFENAPQRIAGQMASITQ